MGVPLAMLGIARPKHGNRVEQFLALAVRRLALLAALLAAGCWAPRPPDPFVEALKKLPSGDDREYEGAFQQLTQATPGVVHFLKRGLLLAPKRGFPVVALLYARGEGDAVPLELRARHLAAFGWPAASAVDNAILEPYTWNEIERDLVRAGRPALRLLADALGREAASEARAVRLARVVLRIGGRAAADELAGLLETERDLGGARVCDVAAGALLLLGRQELALRSTGREALVRSAREWWAKAKDQPEAEWTRGAVAGLVERWEAKDPEGVRPVIELLAGETVEDPKEWWARRPEWRPPGPPLRPEELLPHLSGGRATAYGANRRLEEATGVRLPLPPVAGLGELCAALRLWEPPRDLGLWWKRFLGSAMLRLSIGIIGYDEERKTNHVLWAFETYAHATEDETGELSVRTGGGSALLYVQSLALGTRVVYAEMSDTEAGRARFTAELPATRPLVFFSGPLRAAVVVVVEEVSGRRPPRPQEAFLADLRARLRALAREAEGGEAARALRALGYCQDPGDRDFLRERRAGEALLLLGDPSGFDFNPRLEPYEVEMALRKAEDPGLRERLEKLRDGR
jgi:hypothetical protein